MKKRFKAKEYNITKTGVRFATSDSDLQFVFDRCEELCAKNIHEIAGMRVMQEGAKYRGVWLETQPMAGEMYAKAKENMSPDALDNSWSGAIQGLSVQRSLDALLNYGHHEEAQMIGKKWLANLCRKKYFTQQYNPVTGEHAKADDGYGPTMLAALQYIAYLYGVDFVRDELIWSTVQDKNESMYTQTLFGDEYANIHKNGVATAYKNGKKLFSVTCGVRVYTDLDGTPKRLVGMSEKSVHAAFEYGETAQELDVAPNSVYTFDGEKFVFCEQIPFDYNE